MRLTELFENAYQPKVLVTYPDPNSMESDELRTYLTKKAEGVAQYIQQNCNPWLVEAGDSVVYRGTDSFPDMAVAIIKKVRKNRKPVDSSETFTQIYQMLINMAGGTANRTNSMFVSGDQYQAKEYGTPHVVFPIGDFHYTWSPEFGDWYSRIEDSGEPIGAVMDLLSPQGIQDWKNFQDDGDTFIEDQVEIMSNPQSYDENSVRKLILADRGLTDAIRQEVEIMISCDSAIYLDMAFYQNLVKPLLLR